MEMVFLIDKPINIINKFIIYLCFSDKKETVTFPTTKSTSSLEATSSSTLESTTTRSRTLEKSTTMSTPFPGKLFQHLNLSKKESKVSHYIKSYFGAI